VFYFPIIFALSWLFLQLLFWLQDVDNLYEFPTGNTLPFNIQIPVDQVRGHQQLISRKNLDLLDNISVHTVSSFCSVPYHGEAIDSPQYHDTTRVWTQRSFIQHRVWTPSSSIPRLVGSPRNTTYIQQRAYRLCAVIYNIGHNAVLYRYYVEYRRGHHGHTALMLISAVIAGFDSNLIL
jgi:hypothetical protein